jgi:hypothetical protein
LATFQSSGAAHEQHDIDVAVSGWPLRDRFDRFGRGLLLARGGLSGLQRRLGEQPPEVSGEMAFEAAQRALLGFAFALFASEVLAGGGVVVGAGDRDRVQRPVELAVPAAVKPVLIALAGGAFDRGSAALAGEARV